MYDIEKLVLSTSSNQLLYLHTNDCFSVKDEKLNVMPWMGRRKTETFCQVYLPLAKCHPQSREGVLHCYPE